MSVQAARVLLMLALCGGVAHADDRACTCEVGVASGTATPPEKLVDLNTADEQALLALPGIGPSRARAILAFRASHGGFRAVSQLLNIKGIGRALLRELRPLVTITATPR